MIKILLILFLILSSCSTKIVEKNQQVIQTGDFIEKDSKKLNALPSTTETESVKPVVIAPLPIAKSIPTNTDKSKLVGKIG